MSMTGGSAEMSQGEHGVERDQGPGQTSQKKFTREMRKTSERSRRKPAENMSQERKEGCYRQEGMAIT